MTVIRLPRRAFVAGAASVGGTFLVPRFARGEPEFTMKIATVAPAGTPWASHLKDFKAQIQTGTGGRVKVSAYLGGALGDEIAAAEATKRGSIQVFGGTAGALASAVPELAAVELPYLFSSVEQADKVLDRAVRSNLESLLWARGYKLLFFSENGWRSVGTKFGPVTSPAALRGKKMRSMESDVHLNTWRAMGASPVPMPVTDVLSGLQTGVVDGFDNTPLFAFAASWYQGITDFTLTKHSYQPGLVVASRKWWERLPNTVQTVIEGDPAAEAAKGRKGVRAIRPLLVKNFSNAGIKVHRLSEADRVVFARATAKVHTQFAKASGKRGKALLRKIKAAL